MCIYFTDRTDLHYQKQEHIIPAALGGIATLDCGIVSDEFNREIAELERDYMRNSIFTGFARTVQGPGVRGSLSADKQVRSDIHVLVNQTDPTDLTLGYIQKGIPHQLAQIRYDTLTKAVHVQFPRTLNLNAAEQIGELRQVCQNIRLLKTMFITDDRIPVDTFLFGYLVEAKGPKAFYAQNPNAPFQFAAEMVEQFATQLIISPESGNDDQYPVISNTTNTFKIDHHRVHAKIAFNYLASIYGAAFVKHTCFDPLRSWIVSGGKNNFVTLNQDKAQTIQQVVQRLPPDAHAVILTQGQKHIFGHVIIYGHWVNMVVLTRDAPNMPPSSMSGLVCDWPNRREMDLASLIQIT